MGLLIIIAGMIGLVLLIVWAKFNPFLSFLLVSIGVGLFLGVPLLEITNSIQKGIGGILGGLLIILTTGAMIGKLVAESGASQRIAMELMKISGEKNIQWALMIAGFIIGIPLFYNVGFVLVVPLIFSVAYQYKFSPVYIGLPMLAALSITHGFLPPHPSPSALVVQFDATMGKTLFYGLVIAFPTALIAGPLFAKSLKKIKSYPVKTFYSEFRPTESLPGKFNSFVSALLPVFLLLVTSFLPFLLPLPNQAKSIFEFLADPSIVMILALLYSTYSLGISMGFSIKKVMDIYSEAIKDIAMIIAIIAGAGALKQVLMDSNISTEVLVALESLSLPPLILGWLIAAIIRVLIGSATIAGLTTASIISPLLIATNTDPNLMVISIGAGSLMFSHVNDPGFWMYKEYFNLSLKDTVRSWTLMETIVSICGLVGVLILNSIIT